MNPFRDNARAFRSLAARLRELAPLESNPSKRVKMLKDALWYQDRAKQHADQADDLDERNAEFPQQEDYEP